MDDILAAVDSLEDELMGNLTYAEGTQIVSFQCMGGGAIILNPSLQTLGWTRIGRAVHIVGVLQALSVISPAGQLRLLNLPFTSAPGTQNAAGFAVPGYMLLAGAVTGLIGVVNPSATTANFLRYEGGNIGDIASLVQAGTTFWVGFAYFAAVE
jgi:hypothetical protein